MESGAFGSWVVLTLVLAIVLTTLFYLFRYWGDCRRATARAKVRISWPVTTVDAWLHDTSLMVQKNPRLPSVIGHYLYELGGVQHQTERREPIYGSREQQSRTAEALKANGQVIEVEVQFNPDNPKEASTEIVTEVPTCTWWVGGFMIFLVLMLLLILNGYYALFTR
jgi:hypothetical protein